MAFHAREPQWEHEPPEAPSCPFCCEPFATAAPEAGAGVRADQRPRMLDCGHSLCGACLHEVMKKKSQCCALCQEPTTHASAAAVPINFDLIASIASGAHASAHMAALQLQVAEALTAHKQTAVPCDRCDVVATFYCEQCGDCCAEHSRQLHADQSAAKHNLMRIEQKAGFFANQLRGVQSQSQADRAPAQPHASAQANRCALHPDQIKHLYCRHCDEAVCVVCVHGQHAAHAMMDVRRAAAEQRQALQTQLAQVNDGGGGGGDGAPLAAIRSLRDVQRLDLRLQTVKRGIVESSAQARRDIAALVAEMQAAAERRGAELVQQLQQREAAAVARVDLLLATTEKAIADGVQLRTAVAEASRGDDCATLVAAPLVQQMLVDMRAQLQTLDRDRAEGCVSALCFEPDGKAALLAHGARAGAIGQQTEMILGDRRAAVARPAAFGPSAASSISAPSSAVSSTRSPPASAVAAQPAAPLSVLSQLNSRILQSAHHGDLARFFGKIAVPARLLYRASRDGFEFKDWMARCLHKGPTMTIVKVKESGYVFGAYTHCKWPGHVPSSNDEDVIVADPSGQSFLFSLDNVAGQAVRFSLRHSGSALQVHFGVRFGAYTKDASGGMRSHSNFVLMYKGRAADQPYGNTVNPFDPQSSYQSASIQCPESFLAGEEFFAAADIEVFEL